MLFGPVPCLCFSFSSPIFSFPFKDRTGEIDGLSLVWRPGQKGGWLKLDELPSLKGRIAQSVQPKAPTPAAPPTLSSLQAGSRRKQPSHDLQPRASKPKSAPNTSTMKKGGHKSSLTFSQEAQFDVGRFAESKKAKENARMAKIRAVEAAEAAAGDVRAQERRIAAEKMKAELLAKRAAQHQSGWDEHFTPERLPYYQNRETGDLSWEKPNELKSAEELAVADGDWCWMPDKKEAFLPGKVTSRNGGKIQAVGVDGKNFECAAGEEAGSITNFHSINMREDDLVQMLDVNEGMWLLLLLLLLLLFWIQKNKKNTTSDHPCSVLLFYSVPPFSFPSLSRLLVLHSSHILHRFHCQLFARKI